MRKVNLSGTRVLFVLGWLLCCASQPCAQQPSATKPQQPSATNPQQPSAKPAQTPQQQQPSPAATPAPSTPPEENPQQRRVDKPPPGFDRPGGVMNGPARSLTVDEAIALALGQTSAYRQAQLDERIAAQDVKQARAAFLPQFTVPLTYFGTTPSQVRVEDEPLTFSYVSSSAINETIGLAQATGEIDLSGRLRASFGAAGICSMRRGPGRSRRGGSWCLKRSTLITDWCWLANGVGWRKRRCRSPKVS